VTYSVLFSGLNNTVGDGGMSRNSHHRAPTDAKSSQPTKISKRSRPPFCTVRSSPQNNTTTQPTLHNATHSYQRTTIKGGIRATATMENPTSRRKRKEEARELKRKRIEEAGGVRPRAKDTSAGASTNENPQNAKRTSQPKARSRDRSNHRPKSSFHEKHRFGRVMERVPCRNQPRHWTLSMAVPGSVVSNCQTRELRTQLVGQIARAAAVYQVDEIVVFDDKLADQGRDRGYYRSQRNRSRDGAPDKDAEASQVSPREGDRGDNHERVRSDPHTFMARVLQYCECPQYLRRHFFPMHPDLQFSGLLAPIDAPHHVRVEERSKYREGVVLEKKGTGPDAGSFVNCGIRGRPVE